MLGLFTKKVEENQIKASLRKRLSSTSTFEIVRWTENVLLGIEKNVTEIRKSLAHDNEGEARGYIEDTKTGAWSLLAAMEALEKNRH